MSSFMKVRFTLHAGSGVGLLLNPQGSMHRVIGVVLRKNHLRPTIYQLQSSEDRPSPIGEAEWMHEKRYEAALLLLDDPAYLASLRKLY